MKHPGRWIMAVVLLCAVVCAAGIAASGGVLTHYEYWPEEAALPRLRPASDVLVVQSVEREGARVAVTVRGRRLGRERLHSRDGRDFTSEIRVGPLGIVVDLESANFTGCRVVTMAVAVMFLAATTGAKKALPTTFLMWVRGLPSMARYRQAFHLSRQVDGT